MEDRWPQRERFCELLDQWIADGNGTTAEFAYQVKKSVAMIYSLRSRPTSLPTVELVVDIARVLRCRITELITDPGATIAGQDVTGLTGKEQVLAEIIFQKYRDPEFDEADRQQLFEDFIRDYDRLKAMKARHK